MKIHHIEIGTLKIPLKRPFKTALRTTNAVDDIVIKIFADNGLIGHGSCTQTPSITGETTQSILGALWILKEKAKDLPLNSLEKCLEKIQGFFVHNSSALACFDMALYDIYAQYLNLPLTQFLGGDKQSMTTSLTISQNDVQTMIDDALEAIALGFTSLKIKLGSHPQSDFDKIENIASAVGPQIKLRIDANQGWSTKEALKIIQSCEAKKLNIEFFEQPVHAKNLDGLSLLRCKVQSEILIDESIFSHHDAFQIISKYGADQINIKLLKAGGIFNATKIYQIAQSAFVNCFMGCMLESPIGVAASAHFALAKKAIIHADLDPIFLIANNPVESNLQIKGNTISIEGHAPGLGITKIHDYEVIK